MKLFQTIFKRKCNTEYNVTDEDQLLLDKANSLIGEITRINGVCGDIETVTLTSVIGISIHNEQKEIGFTTDNTFYKRIFYKPETIMNWKYYKPIR